MLEAFILVLAVWLLLVTLYRVFRRRPAARPVHRVDPRQPIPVKRKPPRADVEHVLYVAHWAFTDRPCNYGISNEPLDREAGHKRRSWWWAFSTQQLIEVRRFPNRTTALVAAAGNSALRTRRPNFDPT